MRKRARAVSYCLTIVAIALVFFVIEFATEKSFYPDDEITDILAAMIGALLFSKIKRFFDKATDRIFLHGQHDAHAEFLANVAHELQTPIAILRGNIDVLRQSDAGGAEHLTAERVIVSTLDGMSRLIARVLESAKLRFGANLPERSIVPVAALLEEICEDCAVLAEHEGVKLSVNAEGEDLMVAGDRDRLKEVLLNLMSNAFKHTPSGGKVMLYVVRGWKSIVISIVDSGTGIAAEDLPHIFERFYKIAGGAQGFPPGNGLGLNICREIVEAHGGTISAESKLGHGTTFTISLPFAPPVLRAAVSVPSAIMKS